MFAAALVIAIVAVLLVVLVPASSLWRGDLRGALSGARTGGIQGRGGRLERGLVVAEVALAMLIASGAALLVRSVANLYAIDPGIDDEGRRRGRRRSAAELDVSRQRRQQIEQLRAALATLPGVRVGGAAMKIPLRGGGDSFGITIEGKPDAERTFTYFRIVDAGVLQRRWGSSSQAGRTFDASDRRAGRHESGDVGRHQRGVRRRSISRMRIRSAGSWAADSTRGSGSSGS